MLAHSGWSYANAAPGSKMGWGKEQSGGGGEQEVPWVLSLSARIWPLAVVPLILVAQLQALHIIQVFPIPWVVRQDLGALGRILNRCVGLPIPVWG